MRRTILSARTAACNEATKHLGEHAGDLNAWVEDALADNSPFAFEDIAAAPPRVSPEPSPQEHRAAPRPAPHGRPKKLLIAAARECIAAHVSQNAWSDNTIRQVETAIQLFD